MHNGERLVGMALTVTVLGETALETLAVHPDARRNGVAEALLREVIERARRAGGARFLLEVRESNAAAIALYEKVGMAPCGRRKRYYKEPAEDALIYDLAIGSRPWYGSIPWRDD